MSNLQYLDELDYDKLTAPEVQFEHTKKISAEDLLAKYNFNNELKHELLSDMDAYISNEINNITLEFVSRFFERLGKGSKTAYAVARALGFHVYIKKNGKELHTLKDIAEYWDVCPQLIDQLSKQIQKDLNIEPINNLAIHKKNYSYKVKSPKGFMTTIEVMDFLNLTNKKLNGIIRTLGIKKKDYIRGSKLIAEEDIDRIELYLLEGK